MAFKVDWLSTGGSSLPGSKVNVIDIHGNVYSETGQITVGIINRVKSGTAQGLDADGNPIEVYTFETKLEGVKTYHVQKRYLWSLLGKMPPKGEEVILLEATSPMEWAYKYLREVEKDFEKAENI